MADTAYHYSVANDFPQGAVSVETFEVEIAAAGITSANYLWTTVSGDDCAVWFDDPLSGGDQSLLDGVVAAHEPVPLDHYDHGGIVVHPLPAPSGVQVETRGTPGSTTYGYRVTAFSDTGETLACDEVTISTGATVLDSTDYNRVTWLAVEGAVKYAVYRSTSGGQPSSTGRIRRTELLVCSDKGLAASGSLPSEDKSGALILGGEVTATSTKKLDVREVTTDKSTVSSLVAITRRSSQVVEAGFGSGLYLRLTDDADILRDVGAAHVLWTDPATGVLRTAFRVMVRDGGSSMIERLRLAHDGTLSLAGEEAIGVGLCRVGFPIDGGLRGGSAAASANNNVPSITFAAAGESRIRWTCRPPQNYVSGDLTLRVYCTTAGTPGDTGVRWQLDWTLLEVGDILPSSYDHSVAQTQNLAAVANDQVFAADFTIPAAAFSSAKDMLVLWLRRDGDHADDTCTLSVHTHMTELRYTGRRLAGQAGQ